MASGGYGSRKKEEVVCSEIVTAPPKNLVDVAATVVQTLPATNASQLAKQMYEGPNSALPQRLREAGALAEDARYASLNLITGVAKQAGIPALGQPQISAQRRFPQMLGGRQAAINMVMHVQKEAEESDRIFYSNQLVLNKRRRDEGLLVILNEMINNGMETERLLFQEADAWKKALIRKHGNVVTNMQVAAKEAETLLVEKHNKIVTKMEADARNEAGTQLIQKHKKVAAEMEVELKKAEITLVQNNKRLLSAQVDAHKKTETINVQKYEKIITKMHELRKEAEKLLIQKYEELRTEVDETRKENEEHKREINARKEKEKEMLQKHCNLKAEVDKQYNMYISALTSYEVAKKEQTTVEKEHAEDKRTMNAKLEYLESQLAAAKEEKTTSEKEHEGSKQILSEMNSKPESLESQLAEGKQAVMIVSKNDRQLLALQSQVAELQEDKVNLQEALNALRDGERSKIISEADRVSMELLWEVAQKVLTFPEDVRVCQNFHYASGYDTLLPSREENSVDKMMSCVHAALNEAAKNWKTAQDDVGKIKSSCRKNLVDAVMGHKEPASETKASPRDNVNHVVEYIQDDSENESMEEQPQKKRKRLTTQAKLKKRPSSCSSSNQQTKLPAKRGDPRRFVAGH